MNSILRRIFSTRRAIAISWLMAVVGSSDLMAAYVVAWP